MLSNLKFKWYRILHRRYEKLANYYLKKRIAAFKVKLKRSNK